MYNPDRLKEVYKRTNPTEQKLLCSIIDNHPDLKIIRGKYVLNLERCAKDYKGMNVLILDMKNSNLTASGKHYRSTEFCLINCNGEVKWYDAKQAKTSSNITDLHGEYNRAKNNVGQTMFVVASDGYSDRVLEEHNKYLKEQNLVGKVGVVTLVETQLASYKYF